MLAAAALLAVSIIVRDATQQAFAVVDKIQSGEIPLDPAAIERAIGQTDTTSSTIAWYAVIFIWLVAAIDVYRIGRRLEAIDPPPNPVAE